MEEIEDTTLEDKLIDCIGCGEVFSWEVGEQIYYKARDFTPPKRCVKCREIKHQQRERWNLE